MSPKNDIHHNIHQARRHLKILRSAIRIIQYDISPTQYQTENTFYRDIARNLSKARDQTAMIETITKFLGNKPKSSLREILEKLKTEIELNRQKQLAANRNNIREATHMMRGHSLITKTLNWEADYKDHIVRALTKSYRQSLDCHNICLTKITDENIHEYRKKAKYLRYQLLILHNVWPSMFRFLEQEFHQLTDYLGEANNLTVLKNYIDQSPPFNRKNVNTLISKMQKNKLKLANSAIDLGNRLFAEDPKQFRKRVTIYVQQWTGL